MRVLSSLPFCPCDGRRVSPRYLSALGRYTTACGRKSRSVRVWHWICGVKRKPKAVNKPLHYFIVHERDKPGSPATVSRNQGQSADGPTTYILVTKSPTTPRQAMVSVVHDDRAECILDSRSRL